MISTPCRCATSRAPGKPRGGGRGLGARRAPAAPRRARHDQGILQHRRIADHLGHPAVQGFRRLRRTRSRSRASRAPAPSFSARPMCPSSLATGKATTTFTARPTIRGTRHGRPGGSSGGSSAALAAGFGPLSLGSDIGGSLRVPAHFCGVCAHKPTHGLVASRGHMPPGLPALPGTVDLAVIGPMARSVDDLILALDLIAGPDEAAEGRGYRLSLPPARREKLAEFRVLFIAEHPLLPTSAGVGASLELLSKQLVAAGVDVKRETRAPAGSGGLGSALRQAPERRHVGASAGRPTSGNAGRGRENSCRRSKLDRRARPRRA